MCVCVFVYIYIYICMYTYILEYTCKACSSKKKGPQNTGLQGKVCEFQALGPRGSRLIGFRV